MLIYEINHRFLRKVHTQWPGTPIALERMSIIEEGGKKQVRMAHLATVGSHSVNGVARLHTDLVKSPPPCAISTSSGPNGSTTRPTASPRADGSSTPTRVSPGSSRRASAPQLDRSRSVAAAPDHGFADDNAFHDALIAREKRQQARPRGRRAASAPASSSPDVDVRRCRSSASTSTSGSSWPRCTSSPSTRRLKRDRSTRLRAAGLHFLGKAAPGYAMAKLHIKLLNDIAAVINSDPAVTESSRWLHPQLRRLAGAVHHPRGRPFRSDFDRRQRGVGHQQHEVCPERRAHHGDARRRQRRDSRRSAARELLPLRLDTDQVAAHWGARLPSGQVHRQ